MSHLPPSAEPEPRARGPVTQSKLESLPGRPSDLGGLPIRRLLPRSRRRLVGPWCFLDVFGPLRFDSGKPMDVPPHPHIGLQTVSWLAEGEVLHRDSLGLEGLARPGVVNVMTAGRGIAHSEETPPIHSGRLRGVQLWVALPEASRDVEPGFEQHGDLPVASFDEMSATVFHGELGGHRAPSRTFSPLVGADVSSGGEGRSTLPLEPGFEHALVCLEGTFELDGQELAADTLYYLGRGRSELSLGTRGGGARALLVGGAPFGETVLMWWNFVARSWEEIRAAREDWRAGRRFGEVRGYRGRRTEAPAFSAGR